MAIPRLGRPLSFDREAALRSAVVVFWEHGYAPTSLPQLLSAMGLARSSFYASFGSKHAVMLEALDLYTGELYAEMRAAAGAANPARALADVIAVAACTKRPAHGCLFINMVSELSPQDAAVRSRARRHIDQVNALLCELLGKLGHAEPVASVKSAALLALAVGSISLRKAGASERRIRALLAEVGSLLS